MTKLNLSSREQGIMAVCFSVIFAFGLYRGVYIPIKDTRESLQQQIQLTQRRLLKTSRIISKSRNMEQAYVKILENFRQGASDEKVMSSILSQIESVAGELNIRIGDMKPKKVKKIDFYNNFSVSISMEADLRNIVAFIHKLEHAPHMFHVDELRLDKDNPRVSVLRCRLDLSKVLIPQVIVNFPEE